MGFENFNSIPADDSETEALKPEEKPTAKSSSPISWLKIQSALAGAIAVGFGFTGTAEAGQFHASKEEYPKDADNYLIEKVGEDDRAGVKMNVYTVKDIVTGKQRKFFARSDEEAAGIGPEYVKPLSAHELKAVETEREFQKSGLVAPDPAVVKAAEAGGKTHVEERTFKGYGIETKTKVEVDEKGNVVKLNELQK